MTGICQYEPFGVGHPVVRSGLFLSSASFPLHSRLVAFQKGNHVSQDKEIRNFKFALGALAVAVLSASASAFKRHVADGEIGVSDGEVRVDPESYLGFLDRLFTYLPIGG